MSMTENMKDFVEHNKNCMVGHEVMLTQQGEPVNTYDDICSSDRSLYIFSDGTEMVLSTEDMLSAPDFVPNNDFFETTRKLKKERSLECTDNEAFWDYVNKLHQELEKLESMLVKITETLLYLPVSDLDLDDRKLKSVRRVIDESLNMLQAVKK